MTNQHTDCIITIVVRAKGNGVMVTRGSPKPLLRVRVLLALLGALDASAPFSENLNQDHERMNDHDEAGAGTPRRK